MGDFNGPKKIWRRSETNSKVIASLIGKTSPCLYNNKTQTYLHPESGSDSARDIILCYPTTFIDFNWRIHSDVCGSHHFPIILENSGPKIDQNHHDRNYKMLTGEDSKNNSKAN